MAVGLERGGGLVVDDLVGAENVAAVVDDDVAVEGEDVADAGLAVGVELNGDASGGNGLGLGDGQHLLAGVVWKLRGGAVCGAAERCLEVSAESAGNALVNACPESCR